ncbi:MAG: hypothetical protein M1510_00805, partial [Nitrospirae bacterium]|nr:hypothetical protein [Nitrospirota bacterium]
MKFTKSIGFKMAMAMTVGLFAVISVFSHLSVRLSERELLKMAKIETAKDADRVVSENRRILVVSAAATLLAAILISSALFTRFVKRPINRLLVNMDKVEKGDLDALTGVKG